MAKLKNQEIAKKLIALGLDKDQINIFLDSINEKHWLEAVKIYKNLNIIRKDLDTNNEIYALLKIGKKSFDTNLEVLNNKLISFCNCPHREEAKGCQHIGAVLLYKLLKEKNNDFNKKIKIHLLDSKNKNENDLDYFKNLFSKPKNKERQSMIYFNFEDFERDKQLLKIERGIIKKDGSYGTPMKFYGKKFDSNEWNISKNVKKVLDFINEGDIYTSYDSSVGFSKSKFYDINTDLMMPALRDIYFEEQEIILGCVFSRDSFEISWKILKNKNNDYVLEPIFISGKRKTSLLKMDLYEIGCTTLWVFDNETRCFYEYKNDKDLDIVKNIIRFPKKLILKEEELKKFFQKYYQQVLNNFEINISNDLRKESLSVIPKAKIYLEKAGSTIKINIRFDYSGKEVDYFSKNKEIIVIEKDIIYNISRDFEREEEIVEKLNEYSVVTHEEKDEFMIDNELVDFISEDIPKITEEGIQILGEENLFHFKVIKSKGKMNIDVKKENDWFDIKGKVRFGTSEIDIKNVLEAIFQNKRFIELSEGKKAIIPKNWITTLKSYSGFFDISEDLKLSKHHVSILDSLINLSSSANMKEEIKKVIENFKEFEKIIPTELSKNVHANLRPYQKTGHDWLAFLRKYEFNGILADDMGLGKTLQTLSILQKIKDKNPKNPFLVIVPTSLMFNWKNEIKKFTPNLKVYLHHGQKRKYGKNFTEAVEKNDLIITTYGVLKNDLQKFSEIKFEYIVLDEAHMIKNPMSITAKSVCTLKGKNKLVISGTPIQNNLTELWSLFNFLNPGYLGGYDYFKENFVLPIEKEHDTVVADSLKKIINPFLLRRTKNIISKELPPKTEIVLTSEFSKEEKEIYENWKKYYKNEINESIKEKGVNNSKMKILEGLTKLRQICLHPKMIDTKYEGGSAKFELLLMEIEKIISGGHKVLVFSSFVKMLSIIKSEFEKKGISHSYLDGKTKNREEIVSKFQESENPEVFLISIKAGGLGLNLTSADYVFIIDPWWNPAVEMQAMDRAHRIGQENKVFVYKMIAQATIEDKILELQKSKKKLVEDLIVEEKSLMKDININDIKKIFE